MSSLCFLTSVFPIIIITLQCTMRAGANDEELPPGPPLPRADDADNGNGQQSAEWVKGILESMEGLAEGDTPIWVAVRRSTDVPVQYDRLAPNRTGRAVDYLNSYGAKICPTKLPDDTSIQFRHQTTAENFCGCNLDFGFGRDGLWEIRTLRPIDLRHIYGPRVRLRLAGNAISRHREATPYVHRHSRGDKTLDINSAYRSMLDYWGKIGHPSGDPLAKDHHIVATMTNLKPDRELSFRVRAICPPSYDSQEVDGIIFYDDLDYSGVQVAVREIAHSLGASVRNLPAVDCSSKEGHVMAEKPAVIGRNWPKESLKEISECFKSSAWPPMKPRLIQPFEAPIKPILPGRFMPASEQCRQRGWKDGYVCWDKSSCGQLFCSNKFFKSVCTDSGPAAEGTEFNNNKVCLDGKFISKNAMIAALIMYYRLYE